MSNITWGGTAGDWSVGTLWIGGDVPGTTDIAVFGSTTPYLVTIGTSATNAEFETAAGVVLDDLLAVVSIGTHATLGVGGTIDFEAGTLALAGTVSGATLVGDGGILFTAGGTLLNDTIAHTVSLAPSYVTPLIIGGTLGFAGGGTLVNVGATIDFTGNQSLQGGTLIDEAPYGYGSALDALGTVTFGSGFRFEAEGSTQLVGSFINDGTIIASPLDYFTGFEVIQSNVLTVSGSSFVNNGSIILVNDILDVSGGTTGQLLTLLSGVNTTQGGQIEVTGTIDNRNATIDQTIFGALHAVSFGAAAVLGGTLLTDASAGLPSTLIGVNVVGPLEGFVSGINILGSLSVTAPGGGPGQIVLGTEVYQAASSLKFSASQTLDNATVTLLPVAGGLEYNGLIGDPAATLTLGPGLLVTSTETDAYGYGSQISGAVVINRGTLAAAAGDVLTIGAPSFVNSGTLAAGAGGEIILQAAVTAFSSNGSIELGAGATLALAGPVTPAEVTALASQVGTTGTLALLGSLDLGGGTLDLPGVNLLLGGTVAHGVIDAGNTVSFDGGTLIGATIDGAMTLGSGLVDIVGGLAFGGQGTIVGQGYGSGLKSAGSLTLDNALLLIPPETSPYETGPGTFTLSGTSVTLGTGVTAEVSGALALVAGTLTTGAVITLPAGNAATSLALDAVTIVNTGQISIGAGDTLTLGSAAYNATGNMLSLANTGGIGVATGATIQFLGTESTGQLQTLLSSFGTLGYTIDVLGTLLNAGTSFGPGIGDGDNNVVVNGTVEGGVLQTGATGGGTLTVLGAMFNTVSVDGPLDVAGYLGVYGPLALDTAAGAPGGSVTFTGVNGDLNLTNTTPTLDQATILLTNTDEGINFDTTLSFGPSLLFESEGNSDYINGQYEQISTFYNAGTIAVGGGGLTLGVSTLVNSGIVTVGSGDLLSIIGGFPGGPFSLVENGGSFHFASGATLAVSGNVSASAVATMLAGSSGVTLDLNGVLQNAGSLLAIGGGTIAAAALAGDVVGGTITGTPLSLSGELDGVTYDGTLTIGGAGLSVADGLTVNNAAGGAGGLILAPNAGSGYFSTQPVVTLLDAETLDNAQLVVLASGFAINDASAPVTFGRNFTLSADIAGPTVTAPTITNAGTIVIAAGAGLNLHSDTIVNTGSILVGAGGVLGLDVGYLSGANFSISPGSITIAAGGALEIGGQLSTGSLTTLVQAAAGPGVAVELTGEVINTGATLIANGLFSTLELAGEISGGSLVLPSGSAFVGGAALLEDVAVVGPVTLSATGASLALHDGTTIRSAGGGAGLIIASGNNISLSAANIISYASTPSAIDDALIEVSGTGAALSFGLGALATLDVTGVATETADPGSAGTILVHGTGAYLGLQQASFANSGTILVGAGATLALDSGIAATQTLMLNNTGAINITAGGTIELGGILTTAALEALLGSIVVPGAVVELTGTVINTGTVLDLVAGTSLGNVILDGEIVGGSIVNAGGLLGIGQATLFGGVIFDGTLPLGSGSTLTENGGLTLNDVGGSNPGSIVVSGTNAAILSFDPTLTLDHAALTLSPASGLILAGEVVGFSGVAPALASQVSLGSGFSISDAGNIDVLATRFTDSGTITLSGSHATLIADASTIAVPGTLASGAGGTLALFPSYLIGSYAYPVPSSFSATGHVSIAPGVSLVIGGETTTSGLLAMLTTLGQPGGTLALVGEVDNTGTSFAPVPGGILDTVSLGGYLVGGTLVPGDAHFTYNNPELEGVTVAGSLALTQPSQVITIAGGLTLATPGGGPGTIDLLGSYADSIRYVDSETLDNLVVNVAGGVTNYYQATQGLTDAATLTLGSGVSINDGGVLTLGAAVLRSAATIQVGTSAGLILQGSSVVNSGSIAVAAGGTLELSFPYTGTGVANSFSDPGHLSLATGSTLVIGGVNTTAQLLAELASISNPGVIVEVTGSLINSGTLLQPTAGSLLSNVILDADVIGGTIADGSGSLTILGGELDGVTYQGPLALTGSNIYLNAADGLTLEGTAGGFPGTLAVTGADDTLDFLSQATLDNAILQVGTSAFSVATGNSLPLTLGAGLSVSIASSLLLSGTGINENAPLALTVPGGTLALSSNTIAITAPITVGASAALALGSGGSLSYYGTPPGPLAITGLGEVTLANGATLEIGGVETQAQIATLASGLTNGLLDLFGTVTNTGSVLAVGAAGPFAHVAFSGLIEGGTVTAAAGSASFLQASTFDNVVFDGPLNLGSSIGASLALTGSSSLVAIGSGPETISINGTEQSLLFAPMLVETLDNTQISLGTPVGGTPLYYTNAFGAISGTLVLGPATTLSAAGGVLEALGGVTDTSLVNRGLITVSQGGLTVEGDTGYDYFDTGAGSVVNAGVIAAGSSGFLELLGNFTNDGTIALSQSARARFGTAPLGGGTISFAGGQEVVDLAAPGLFTATFQNFAGGNTLDFSDLPFVSSAVSSSFTNGTLTVSSGTVAVADIVMTGSIAYAAGDFTPTQDSFGDTEIVSTAPCFVHGTRLRT